LTKILDKDYFYFKDFKLRNRDAALKINTDGVLLAAWANLSAGQRVLDIGTAGGVIAFLLSRRFSDLEITGIDICEKSIEEAKHNIQLNPKLGSPDFQCVSLQQFEKTNKNKFDHIISNPPFFSIMDRTKEVNAKQKAKHHYTLSLNELLVCSARLLTAEGSLSLILPYQPIRILENQASQNGFQLSRFYEVSGKPSKEPNRMLLEFTKEILPMEDLGKLHVRNEDASYSEEYKSLTKDYYLNF